MGFEPTAACLGSRCATTALHPPVIQSLSSHDSYPTCAYYITLSPLAQIASDIYLSPNSQPTLRREPNRHGYVTFGVAK